MAHLKMVGRALGILLGFTLSLSGVAAELSHYPLYLCKDGRKGKSVAFVYFEAGHFKSVDFRGTKIAAKNWITFDQSNSTFEVVTLGKQKFLQVSQDLRQIVEGAVAQISFMVEEDGRKLSPEESLLGEAKRDNDPTYGKLQFQLTAPGGIYAPGWTISLYCDLY